MAFIPVSYLGIAGAPPPSGINLVQSATSFTSGTSNQIVLTGVTAGNFITLAFGYYQFSVSLLSAASDSNGTLIAANVPSGQVPSTGGNLCGTGIYYVENTNAGTHTFTVPLVTGGDVLCSAVEWSGMPTSGTLDKHPIGGSSGTAGLLTIGTNSTGTLTQASELVIAVFANGNTGPGVTTLDLNNDPPAGWTRLYHQLNTQTTIGLSIDYTTTAATTAQSVNWTWSNDTSANVAQGTIATFMSL